MDLIFGSASSDVATFPNISPAALAHLSQIMTAMQDEVALTVTFEEVNLKEYMIIMLLATFFFGLFTVLVAVAVYILSSKGLKRKRIALMITAIIAMWVSAAANWIAIVVAAAKTFTALHTLSSQVSARTTQLQDCLCSLSGSDAGEGDCHPDGVTEWSTVSGFDVINNCIGTAAMGLNIVISDSIVWWRAWVLWPDSRVVHWVCVLMIVITSVSAAMATASSCRFETGAWAADVVGHIWVDGKTVNGDLWTLVTGLSSLFTNTVATTLIAYCTWQHRRIILSYLKRSSGPRSQVERVLALLVESGVLCCGLSVLSVVYEFAYLLPGELYRSSFVTGVYYIMNGCAVPLVGMYPTLIIIVCAVEKSLYEKATENEVRNVSMLFNVVPPGRRRETLPELLSVGSAHALQEPETQSIDYSSEHPKDAVETRSEEAGIQMDVSARLA